MDRPTQPLSLDELRAKLRDLAVSDDPTLDHEAADDLLLEYIADTEVSEAFKAIFKFYE